MHQNIDAEAKVEASRARYSPTMLPLRPRFELVVSLTGSLFSIRVLEYENENAGDASGRDRDPLPSLLPASYRKESGDLVAAGRHVMACVEKELDLQRLASVHGRPWVAGLPLPPRALHTQLLLGREIFITERIDMHLV